MRASAALGAPRGEYLVEASRGFWMRDEWDPTALCAKSGRSNQKRSGGRPKPSDPAGTSPSSRANATIEQPPQCYDDTSWQQLAVRDADATAAARTWRSPSGFLTKRPIEHFLNDAHSGVDGDMAANTVSLAPSCLTHVERGGCNGHAEGGSDGHADSGSDGAPWVDTVSNELNRAFPRFAPPLEPELRDLCRSFGLALGSTGASGEACTDACSAVCGDACGATSATAMVASATASATASTAATCHFVSSVRALFARLQKPKQKKGSSSGSSSTPQHPRSSGGGGTSTLFALAREALALATRHHPRGLMCALALVRALAGGAEERLHGSLLVAAVTYSGEARCRASAAVPALAGESAQSVCAALVADVLAGRLPLRPSLLLDLLLAAGPARTKEYTPPSVASDYAHQLIERREWKVLVGLTVELDLYSALDVGAVLAELADRNEWSHAEKLAADADARCAADAVDAAHTPDAPEASNSSETVGAVGDGVAAALGPYPYRAVQKAAKAATAAAVRAGRGDGSAALAEAHAPSWRAAQAPSKPPQPAGGRRQKHWLEMLMGMALQRGKLPQLRKLSRRHGDADEPIDDSERAVLTRLVRTRQLALAHTFVGEDASLRSFLKQVSHSSFPFVTPHSSPFVTHPLFPICHTPTLPHLSHTYSPPFITPLLFPFVTHPLFPIRRHKRDSQSLEQLIEASEGSPGRGAPSAHGACGMSGHMCGDSCEMTLQCASRSGGALGATEHEGCLLGGGSRADVMALPPYELPVPFSVVEADSPEAIEGALAPMLEALCNGELPPLLGIDAEWVGKSPVSLLQIATTDRCVLCRLRFRQRVDESAAVWGEHPISPSLRAILLDPYLLKVGVGVGNDLRLLRQHYGLHSAGGTELGPLAIRAGLCRGGGGLQRLAAEVLGRHLAKPHQLRCGDWEAEALTAAQREYAAKDAIVSLDIAMRLYERESSLGGVSSAHPIQNHPAGSGLREWASGLREWASGGGLLPATRRADDQTVSAHPKPPAATTTANDPTGAPCATSSHSSCATSSHSCNPCLATEASRKTSGGGGAQGLAAGGGGIDALDSHHLALEMSHLGLSEVCELRPALELLGKPSLEVKSLALFVLQTPLIAVLPSERKLCPLKLASHLELALSSRKAISRQVRLATHAECVRVFGYVPGTVPPFGHRAQGVGTSHTEPDALTTPPQTTPPQPLPVIVDETCAGASHLLAGGGSAGVLLRVPSAALLALPHARRASICVDVAAAAVASVTATLPPPAGAFEAPRFLVDWMLGRLLRWLRCLGVDSLRREESESTAKICARARSEQRILITRDHRLLTRREADGCAVFAVGSDEPREQLHELVRRFGLKLRADDFMMRCAVCNGRGYEAVPRSAAEKRADCPRKVYENVDEFFQCKSCHKLYWEGPKSNGSFAHFSGLFESFGDVRQEGRGGAQQGGVDRDAQSGGGADQREAKVGADSAGAAGASTEAWSGGWNYRQP